MVTNDRFVATKSHDGSEAPIGWLYADELMSYTLSGHGTETPYSSYIREQYERRMPVTSRDLDLASRAGIFFPSWHVEPGIPQCIRPDITRAVQRARSTERGRMEKRGERYDPLFDGMRVAQMAVARFLKKLRGSEL